MRESIFYEQIYAQNLGEIRTVKFRRFVSLLRFKKIPKCNGI